MMPRHLANPGRMMVTNHQGEGRSVERHPMANLVGSTTRGMFGCPRDLLGHLVRTGARTGMSKENGADTPTSIQEDEQDDNHIC